MLDGFRKKIPYLRIAVLAYAIILLGLNAARMFDYNFWNDEAFTVNLVRGDFVDIIRGTAADVHPPLYYFIVKLAYILVGERGWAYHAVSLIPYVVIIGFALTSVWKKWGGTASIILITIAGLSDNAVIYNTEVRMYSWGALFVLLSYYAFDCIMEQNSTRDYVFFVIWSLAAAYTHYYCLISVAFLYIALLLYTIVQRRDLKAVVIAYAATITGYLPWFIILLKTLFNISGGYWITDVPTFEESILYIFSDQFPAWIWLLITIIAVIAVMYEAGVLQVHCDKSLAGRFTVDASSIRSSNNLILMMSGLLSILGTIGFGLGISALIRPFYLVRYIYPVSAIAWLLLGIWVSRLQGRRIVAILLTAYMLSVFYPMYQQRYLYDMRLEAQFENTLHGTADMASGDVIMTDDGQISRHVAETYYPNNTCELIALDAIPELDPGTTYWFFLTERDGMENAGAQLIEQGFDYEMVIDNGYLGSNTVCVYKVVHERD